MKYPLIMVEGVDEMATKEVEVPWLWQGEEEEFMVDEEKRGSAQMHSLFSVPMVQD